MNSSCVRTRRATRSSHRTFLKSALVTWRRRGVQKQIDDLRSWGLDGLCSFCPVSVTSKEDHEEHFQFSTFHRLSSFILQNPAAFTTPSVVMMRMLPVLAWCPRYRPTHSCWLHSTCNCSCYRWAVVDGCPRFCNAILPSTSRASHVSRQAISANPEETDRI